MTTVCRIFSNSGEVSILDNGNDEVSIQYGKKGDGYFVISWRDLYELLYGDEKPRMEMAYFDGKCLVIKRIRDYISSDKVLIENIPDEYKIGNVYSHTFTEIETAIVVGFIKEFVITHK